jgi:hypothetical protein
VRLSGNNEQLVLIQGVMIKRNELIEEHGTWLRSFEWQYFVTFTFRRPVSKHGARSLLTSYFDRLCSDINRPLCMYWTSEAGTYGLRVHAHCLLMGLDSLTDDDTPSGVTRLAIDRLWRHGSTSLSQYDRTRGAAFYICKTSGSGKEDWDLLGNPVRLNPAPLQPTQPQPGEVRLG